MLEEQLGFSLFVRMTRQLALTQEGERLLDALTPSFNRIFSEIDDIKFNELSGRTLPWHFTNVWKKMATGQAC